MASPGRVLMSGTVDPTFAAPRGSWYLQTTSDLMFYNFDGTASGWKVIPTEFSEVITSSNPGVLGFYSGFNPNSTTLPALVGILNSLVAADTTSARVQDADGSALAQTSNVAAGTQLSVGQSTDAGDRFSQRRYNPTMNVKFKQNQTTDTRLFWGYTSVNRATTLGSDDPAAHLAGIQARSTDTNFFFVVKDGTTLLRVDSGIAKDTAAHFMVVTMDDDAPSVTVKLYDTDFVLEASHTFTTNLPGSTTALGWLVGVESVAGSAKTVHQYYGYFAIDM